MNGNGIDTTHLLDRVEEAERKITHHSAETLAALRRLDEKVTDHMVVITTELSRLYNLILERL